MELSIPPSSPNINMSYDAYKKAFISKHNKYPHHDNFLAKVLARLKAETAGYQPSESDNTSA
ncbi:hypothetical protein CPB84DRAFT_1847371 [Gymnopilus junonius]|uniref:Uncharacterized protein n=1 Tax=Gymnopilus junonius TaxID=109634 RepID=A0A9P5NMD2_GYMJU|nr:hypothetical protein CPB84DRAFT_1847371 [Gymnopilus junonius]